MDRLQKLWYRNNAISWLLAPLAAVFKVAAGIRKYLYQHGILKSYRSSKPVIVVGNLSVGGNGKTPVVIYLVEQLTRLGLKVGVVSRGYGGKVSHYPYTVREGSTPAKCGDEPFMIYIRCRCPVVVSTVRADAVKKLEKAGVDVIISDDGLQHYAMERDYEIVVVDGERRFGNGHVLPMGPLREDLSRLETVDAVIINGGKTSGTEYSMKLQPRQVVKVCDFSSPYNEDSNNVTALAGIGYPPRFFNTLRKLGYNVVEEHACSDHAEYDQTSILSSVKDVTQPIIMTEKDAVKCRNFACNNWYVLRVDAVIDPGFINHLSAKLKLTPKHNGGKD